MTLRQCTTVLILCFLLEDKPMRHISFSSR
uniref:Uncharacterized protein n=1 Tax=Setaria italica TaxID=4555 RepID=K3YNV7_SETIT